MRLTSRKLWAAPKTIQNAGLFSGKSSRRCRTYGATVRRKHLVRTECIFQTCQCSYGQKKTLHFDQCDSLFQRLFKAIFNPLQAVRFLNEGVTVENACFAKGTS